MPLFLFTAIALALFSASPAFAQRPTKPNIVWIWADNLAYGDLGVYGNRRIKMPVIDKLAEDGARFMQYYIAHVVCSPSRAGLLTGRQPFRAGIVDVLRPDSPIGLPDDEITLAEALRELGYVCGAFGKWHLGDRTQYLPTHHGFHSYLGLPYSMDMAPTVLIRDDKVIEALPGDKVKNVTERLVADAVKFIAANKRRPFFLYFSHTLPHPPVNLPKKYIDPKLSIYENGLEHIDRTTGVLLKALDQHGLTNNTLVCFSSDNGPMGKGGDTGGLRGGIRDSYEGGVRVPLLARWPGRIPKGRVVQTPAIAYDIFPTAVRLAGGKLPKNRIYDGRDIWPLMSGKGDFPKSRTFIWAYTDNVTAVRDGDWKLHLGNRDKMFKSPELYNLESDPQEKRNLASQHADVVRRLQMTAADLQKQMPKVWSLKYPVRDPKKAKGGVRRE